MLPGAEVASVSSYLLESHFPFIVDLVIPYFVNLSLLLRGCSLYFSLIFFIVLREDCFE